MDSVLKLFVANAQLRMVNGQLSPDLHFKNLSLRQQNDKARMAVHRLGNSDWQTPVFFLIELLATSMALPGKLFQKCLPEKEGDFDIMFELLSPARGPLDF